MLGPQRSALKYESTSGTLMRRTFVGLALSVILLSVSSWAEILEANAQQMPLKKGDWVMSEQDNNWNAAAAFINAHKPSGLDGVYIIAVLMYPPFTAPPCANDLEHGCLSYNDYRFYTFCRHDQDENVEYKVGSTPYFDPQNQKDMSRVVEPFLRNPKVKLSSLFYSQYPPKALFWYVEKIK